MVNVRLARKLLIRVRDVVGSCNKLMKFVLVCLLKSFPHGIRSKSCTLYATAHCIILYNHVYNSSIIKSVTSTNGLIKFIKPLGEVLKSFYNHKKHRVVHISLKCQHFFYFSFIERRNISATLNILPCSCPLEVVVSS